MINNNQKRFKMSVSRIRTLNNKILQNKANNHSDFFQKSVRLYICQKKREEIKESLKWGYQEMADLNREMADEDLINLCETFSCYEDSLAECE
ncbi:MAG: CopG family transcriptional regulator [Halarsenatibacteraceae bacterium]